MTIEYDEKGKFFTNVVAKSAIPAVIQTLTNRIEGHVYVRPGTRLKDELDQASQFLAVTNAVVYQAGGEKLYECGFMAVNLDHVVWIIPDDRTSGGSE